MAGIDLIRAAIAARLAAIPRIGRVHDRERYAATEPALRALYAWQDGPGTPSIRGWFVRRTASHGRGPDLGRRVVTHSWAVRGLMSFDDGGSSEHAFDALIEAVMAAVLADDSFGGTALGTVFGPDGAEFGAGAQLVESGPVMFAGLLCHGATLTLHTRHLG
jgi:hypothetical protein